MGNLEDLNIISRTEFVILAHHKKKNQDVILVKSDENLENFKYFKSINVFDSVIDGEKYILLALMISSDDLYPWYDLIVSNFKGNLFEALNNIKKILESTSASEDYLKFRGDYAEALFMFYHKNARKLSETETADILLDGVIYEIKSFSPNKKSVIISMKQIIENTTKLAIPLLNDNDGKTIIELADSIEDKIFSEYLYLQYQNSKYALNKYKSEEFININNLMPILDLPANIKEADFVIDISENLK